MAPDGLLRETTRLAASVIVFRMAPEPAAACEVLVVEDFEDARVLYAEALTGAGFTVGTACDGAEALGIVTATRRVEAVVMDLQMPVLDGWEAIRRIRSEVGAAPYILVVSAYDGPVSLAEVYDAGADDFLGKPVDPRVLVTIVRAALRFRRGPTARPPLV